MTDTVKGIRLMGSKCDGVTSDICPHYNAALSRVTAGARLSRIWRQYKTESKHVGIQTESFEAGI